MQEKNLFFKRALLGVCLLAVCWLPVHAEVLPGDVDGDGKVNINDVTALINYLLKQDASLIVQENADVDASGRVNIDDVTTLIGLLLKGGSGTNPDPDEHDWVDLGLPSGTLWATCNVGADSPEDYGDYFAWGETEPKDDYALSTYKWYQCDNDYGYCGYTKYCTLSSYGYNDFVDGKTELDPEDDAAYVNWGLSWRMPSLEQIRELCDNCTWKVKMSNGVHGRLVTGPNGNSMFLPSAGYRQFNSLINFNDAEGSYWSRTLSTGNMEITTAYYLYFYRTVGYGSHERYYGRTVRAVRVP